MDIKDIKKINNICEEIKKYSDKLKQLNFIDDPFSTSVLYVGFNRSDVNLMVAYRDGDVGLDHKDYFDAINNLVKKYREAINNKINELMEQLKKY